MTQKHAQGRKQEWNRWMERKKEWIKRKECEVVRLGRETQRNYGGEMVKRGGGMQVEKESAWKSERGKSYVTRVGSAQTAGMGGEHNRQ